VKQLVDTINSEPFTDFLVSEFVSRFFWLGISIEKQKTIPAFSKQKPNNLWMFFTQKIETPKSCSNNQILGGKKVVLREGQYLQ